MSVSKFLAAMSVAGLMCAAAPAALAQTYPASAVSALKTKAEAGVEARAKLAQQMNDSIFSFGELAFQEVETSNYVTGVLEKNGFTIQRGVAGLPTGWTATWTHGQGGPVIVLGSDRPYAEPLESLLGEAATQAVRVGNPHRALGRRPSPDLGTGETAATPDSVGAVA